MSPFTRRSRDRGGSQRMRRLMPLGDVPDAGDTAAAEQGIGLQAASQVGCHPQPGRSTAGGGLDVDPGNGVGDKQPRQRGEIVERAHGYDAAPHAARNNG